MKLKILYIFFVIFASSNFGQAILFQKSIGNFESAAAFAFTPSGYFFVADESTNEILKIDTLGNSVQSIGGYGWEQSTFDQPSDVFATDLRVYVTDKNNNRIQVFDKDLNYLFVLESDEKNDNEKSFQYPTSCATSTQGDIYVLDSDNLRVLKFNSDGIFLLEFGNYDSADFMLTNPTKLAVSQDSKIFVLDNDKLNVYDQFGMGLLQLTASNDITNINITFDNLILNNDDSLYYNNLRTYQNGFINITPKDINEDTQIIEGLLFNNNLFVLTRENILCFKIIKERSN